MDDRGLDPEEKAALFAAERLYPMPNASEEQLARMRVASEESLQSLAGSESRPERAARAMGNPLDFRFLD